MRSVTSSVGVPAEIKDGERRVALSPSAIRMLTRAKLRVLVQRDAGVRAGFSTQEYEDAGAQIVDSPDEVWTADLVVKVKEPQPEEYRFFRDGLKLFAYLHLAAEPKLAAELARTGVEAHAFETVQEGGSLPLLAPMSEVAGRAAAIIGASQLAAGRGTLMGGAAGVRPARVVVIGLGIAGMLSARGARGMDAQVTGIDVNLSRLRECLLSGVVDATLTTQDAADAVEDADLVIGAALVPGDRAPVVVGADVVKRMRPGSVIVDLSIDQGGCLETSHVTSISHPTYDWNGVIHYCVPNVPSLYPETASRALSAALAPRVLDLALVPNSPTLNGSLNVAEGQIRHPVVSAVLSPLQTSGTFVDNGASKPVLTPV